VESGSVSLYHPDYVALHPGYLLVIAGIRTSDILSHAGAWEQETVYRGALGYVPALGVQA
jgi:hypothetical protein